MNFKISLDCRATFKLGLVKIEHEFELKSKKKNMNLNSSQNVIGLPARY
jgi:hypothetical protein